MTDQAEGVPSRPCANFLQGPPADGTCQMTRVVRRRGTRFEVWTCTDPRPTIRVKLNANRFPTKDAKRWWPGCTSAWYDALYHPDRSCTPGRTQFVVYDGERGRPKERARKPFPMHWMQHRLAFGGGDPGVPKETGLVLGFGRGVIALYFPKAGEIRRYQVDSAARLRAALSGQPLPAVAQLCEKYGALRIQYVQRSVELAIAKRECESVCSVYDSPLFSVRLLAGRGARRSAR